MRPPTNELHLPASPWRADGPLPPLPLPADEAPVTLAAPAAATRPSLGVAAAPPTHPQEQQSASSCCLALGLFVVALILVLAWLVHSESKSWEGY